MISAYSLNIPLDRETKLALFLDGTQICYTPLPSLQNQADLSGDSPDPGISQNPDNTVRWDSGSGDIVQNPDNFVHWW